MLRPDNDVQDDEEDFDDQFQTPPLSITVWGGVGTLLELNVELSCFVLNQASSFEWNQLHVQLFNYFAFLCLFGSFEAVFEWNKL